MEHPQKFVVCCLCVRPYLPDTLGRASPAAASVLALSEEEWITVEVEARASPSEAKQNAITEGVRRIVGEYIEYPPKSKTVKWWMTHCVHPKRSGAKRVGSKFDGDDVMVLMQVEVIPKTIVEQVEKAAASGVHIARRSPPNWISPARHECQKIRLAVCLKTSP